MSKLVIYTQRAAALRDEATEFLVCTFRDELKFSHRIGEPVLIADIAPETANSYVALGQLAGFRNDRPDRTLVEIEQVRLFPEQILLLSAPKQAEGIDELSDDVFARVISQATAGAHLEEGFFPQASLPIHAFSSHLAKIQRQRCSFSDVRTENGAAFIIRPLNAGGRWHADNFLFLDPEPGELFTALAWTVGPKMEILMDAWAMGAGIAETVNRTGLLALVDTIAAWPDQDALAWHRRQFAARLDM